MWGGRGRPPGGGARGVGFDCVCWEGRGGVRFGCWFWCSRVARGPCPAPLYHLTQQTQLNAAQQHHQPPHLHQRLHLLLKQPRPPNHRQGPQPRHKRPPPAPLRLPQLQQLPGSFHLAPRQLHAPGLYLGDQGCELLRRLRRLGGGGGGATACQPVESRRWAATAGACIAGRWAGGSSSRSSTTARCSCRLSARYCRCRCRGGGRIGGQPVVFGGCPHAASDGWSDAGFNARGGDPQALGETLYAPVLRLLLLLFEG